MTRVLESLAQVGQVLSPLSLRCGPSLVRQVVIVFPWEKNVCIFGTNLGCWVPRISTVPTEPARSAALSSFVQSSMEELGRCFSLHSLSIVPSASEFSESLSSRNWTVCWEDRILPKASGVLSLSAIVMPVSASVRVMAFSRVPSNSSSMAFVTWIVGGSGVGEKRRISNCRVV